MNRFLNIIFFIIIFIITLQSGYFFYLKKTIKKRNSLINQNLNNKNQPKFKIIYQKPDDKEGRTVIYETAIINRYQKVGWNTLPSGLKYLVGQFSHWLEIPSSKDRYLILSNPFSSSYFEPIRVIFEPSELFPSKKKVTRITVENLNRVKTSSNVDEGMEDFEFLLEINKLSNNEINQLIQKGDVIVVVPLQKYENGLWKQILNKNQEIIANQIIIRRWDGYKALKK